MDEQPATVHDFGLFSIKLCSLNINFIIRFLSIWSTAVIFVCRFVWMDVNILLLKVDHFEMSNEKLNQNVTSWCGEKNIISVEHNLSEFL